MSVSWKLDVEESISGLRVSAKGYVRINCPACETRAGDADNSRSLSVSVRSGWYKCWRSACNWRGRLDGDFDEEDFDEEWIEDTPLEDPGVLADVCTSRWAREARDYLTKRGIPAHVWAEAKLGVVVSGDQRNKGRIVFPTFSATGEMVGWQSRHPDGRPPRYRTAEGMDRVNLFYRDQHLTAGKGPIVLVEGPFDALAQWDLGAMGFLGKPSHAQLERLLGCKRPLVWLLDGDAWMESLGYTDWMRSLGKTDVWHVRLPPGEDPCSVKELAAEAATFALKEKSDVVVC